MRTHIFLIYLPWVKTHGYKIFRPLCGLYIIRFTTQNVIESFNSAGISFIIIKKNKKWALIKMRAHRLYIRKLDFNSDRLMVCWQYGKPYNCANP
jgi:hypothetical protein